MLYLQGKKKKGKVVIKNQGKEKEEKKTLWICFVSSPQRSRKGTVAELNPSKPNFTAANPQKW